MTRYNFLSCRSSDNDASVVRLMKIGSVLLLLVFLLSFLGGPVPSVKAASTITFTGQELLGRPTNSAITITVVPAETVSIYYEYGTASGVYTSQTTTGSATDGQPYKVVIGGLNPDTQY